MFLFAEDGKCLSIIRSISDCIELQNNINVIDSWSESWQLPLAHQKYGVITFVPHAGPIIFQYKLSDFVIIRLDVINDLGLLFTYNLSFSSHIDKICCTARSRAAMILKSFSSRDKNLLIRAFVQFVCPTLEHSSVIWNPFRLNDIRKLETVQRKFTKRLIGLQQLSYEERLQVLQIDSLQIRRIKTDLNMYYKIINNLTILPCSDYFTVRAGITRSNGNSLLVPKSANNIEKYLFRNRLINLWNNLPISITKAPSLKKCNILLENFNLLELLNKLSLIITSQFSATIVIIIICVFIC